MSNELLKKTEEHKDLNQEQQTSAAITIDSEKVKTLVKVRKEKLEAVKPFISLKLYQQLALKLKSEEEYLLGELESKSKEAAKQNREQGLPKSFFEQRHLKIKTIRID
ncbi:MAG: hypothetical protein JWO40_5 [Candidatus Doudnabacteria bacterium]|nr:hypothetical protein [Candidatus Doudnabacteria bacterium]